MISKILMLLAYVAPSFAGPHAPAFNFIGQSPKGEFHEVYERASKRLEVFYGSHKWKSQVPLAGLINSVEIFATKLAFDKKIIQLSEGQMTTVPKTYVGVADKKVLRVVSWSEYKKVHTQDSLIEYEKLLTHEMAHQLHIELLNGDENLMGPVWFFEGFAVIAADQYSDFQMTDRKKVVEIIQSPSRGDYKAYGAILREIVKSKTLPELVEMAKSSEFNSKVLALLK